MLWRVAVTSTNRWPPQRGGAVSFKRMLDGVHSYSKCNTASDENGDLAIRYATNSAKRRKPTNAVPPDHLRGKVHRGAVAAAGALPRRDRPHAGPPSQHHRPRGAAQSRP